MVNTDGACHIIRSMYDVAILGAGAVGSVVGAVLNKTEQDVLLVGRENHVNCINEEGLEFRDARQQETHSLNIEAQETLESAATVFLTTKMPDVTAGLKQIREIAPEATVVPLQNGVRADDMAADIVGRDHVVGGVALLGAEFLEPGQVTLIQPGTLLLGNPWGTVNTLVESVMNLFPDNDWLAAQTHTDLRGARWTKLLINLNNALPAITGESLQTIYKDNALTRIATRAFWEGTQTARKAGRPLASLPEVPRFLLLAASYVPHWLGWRPFRNQILDALGDEPFRPSTLQSVLRGGPDEIEYLNGEIVALGREIDSPTPVNRALVEMVHEVEETGDFLSRETVLAWDS